jgi:hypothetical protein
MYVIRETLNCRPGKVRAMIEGFQVISRALQDMERRPLRLLTDVAGEDFWTLVVEATVESMDEFVALEGTLMANDSVRSAMAGYHELIQSGRRQILRVEG